MNKEDNDAYILTKDIIQKINNYNKLLIIGWKHYGKEYDKFLVNKNEKRETLVLQRSLQVDFIIANVIWTVHGNLIQHTIFCWYSGHIS